MASMRAKGNARVNGDLNPFPERFPFPSLQRYPYVKVYLIIICSDQQQYIKDKYERKLFSATNAVKSPIMGTSKPILGAERTFTAEIRSLREMGFMDAQACLAALKKTNGNVNQAVDILFAAEEQPLQKVAKEPEQPVLKDDPWSKVVADHKEALNPVSPPPYLEDPFADWK